MREEILTIYNNFSIDSLDLFFDELINYVKKYDSIFLKYTSLEYLDEMKKFKSKNLILGHSDDNLEIAIPFYTNKIKKGLNEEEMSKQVSSLIWDLSAYMTDEECPSCHDSNLRLTVATSNTNQIIKFCDECLYTGIADKHVDVKDDLIPAPKNLVKSYLKC
ncbi:hypothetical protein A5821_000282 [Enterococcus sp. 7F3_DIV0205]|uniref:Uncharacterized protein n=1 Tax=Candidatus Enterococcus palustris TaxID=1834189 RepID=A0AAQ3W829_9ENTE|nr:hypothetical protein [Enterococcus sp. 7F3_DIV0205]OTN84695.1 hypothetical protein A5821_000624 [Enterococcus sp. 7F3_DIV0205]